MSMFSQYINGILLLNSFNNDSTSQTQQAQTFLSQQNNKRTASFIFI